jgi:uncharacterized membrane protein
MLKKNLQKVLKIIIALVITYGVCYMIFLFADYIAINYLIKKHIVNWSLYTGFPDDFFFLFSFFLSFFILSSNMKQLKVQHVVAFIGLYLFLDFALDMYEDYRSGDWALFNNRPYTYSIFKSRAIHRLDVVHYLTKNFATFMVYEFCCFVAIICISVLSMLIKNKLIEKRLISDHSSILKR